jgi:hypothetical protein
MPETRFQIQYWNPSNRLWCESASKPTHDDDCDKEEVWKAYTIYISLAYPDILYRLVLITTTKTVEPIHV